MAKIYTKTTWKNTPSTATPINDDNLNNIEDGIVGLDEKTQFQTAENKAVFNGVTSNAVSGTFTSFNAETIYFELDNKNSGLFVIDSFNNDSNMFIQILNNEISIKSATGFQTTSSGVPSITGIHKVVFRWNVSQYDIIIDGVKYTTTAGGSGNATKLAITKNALGYREANNDSYWEGDINDSRISSTTITEAQAIGITDGSLEPDDYLTWDGAGGGNTQLVYRQFGSSSTTIGNLGTLMNFGDLTVTDVVKGDFTEFDSYIMSNEGWIDWNPIFTNLSGGTLNFAKYTQIGKTIHYKLKYTMTGANVTGIPTFTLPVTANSDLGIFDTISNSGVLNNQGTGTYANAVVRLNSSTVASMRYINFASGLISGLSATDPFTWASGDYYYVQGTYEAA